MNLQGKLRMKKKESNNGNQSKVSEPEVQYQKSKLKIFTSFEEENDATAKMNASLSHEEHFRIAHEMIKAMYKKEIENMPDPPYSNITFTVINGLPV